MRITGTPYQKVLYLKESREMGHAKSIYHCQGWLTALFTVFVSVLSFLTSSGQSNLTYTVDPDFSTGETLRSKTSVFDIYPLEDGGYFLGGGFNMIFTNPDSPFNSGLAMITASGSVHPSWDNGGGVSFAREIFDHDGGYLFATGETLIKSTYDGFSWYLTFGEAWGDYYLLGEWGSGFDNPYNVRWTWDIFILEDQSVLIGGAIATDTLQPGLFRHLMRLLPDGSHDDTFPIIEAMPQGLNTHISKIERASDGSWYVSGRFQGINGHISPHIAHLTADFEVDTDFVSPFYYESVCCDLHTEMKLLDSQGRIWMGGQRVRLASDPNDHLQLVRLLPDGTVDPAFAVGKIDCSNWNYSFEKPPLINGMIENDNGDFFVHGRFSHYNDTQQLCIAAINDEGTIQENYFNGAGATVNYYDPDDPEDVSRPSAFAMELLDDGSLMIAGAFSDFMGVERYSMVKLNPGTLSSGDLPKHDSTIKVYPNPASTSIAIPLNKKWSQSITSIQIIDLSGRTVAKYPWGNGEVRTLSRGAERSRGVVEVDVTTLANGLYLLHVLQDGKPVSSEKLVVQR